MSVNDNLKTSQNGLDFVAKWEGCILTPYMDILKYWTIGIGKLILPTDSFSTITNAQVKDLLSSKDKNHPVAKIKIPKQEALDLLAKEAKKCEDAIKQYITVPLNQNQFDALVSWSFNCGTGVLKTSTLTKVLNAGDYNQVPDRLLDWTKGSVNGVKQVVPGLKNRRISEGQLWSKPVANSVKVDDKDDEPLFSEEEKKQIQAVVEMNIMKQMTEILDRDDHLDEENKVCV